MNPIGKIKTLAKHLTTARSATAEIVATDEQLRREIDQRERALLELRDLGVPRDELRERMRAYVAETGAAYLDEHGRAFVSAVDNGPTDAELRGTPRIPVAGHQPLPWGAVCAGMPDLAVQILTGLQNQVPYAEGLPGAERPARIAQLEAELAELKRTHEAFVDEAAAAGVSIPHRLEVQQRREAAARRTRDDAAAIAERDRRQQAIDARTPAPEFHRAAVGRGRSQYLEQEHPRR